MFTSYQRVGVRSRCLFICALFLSCVPLGGSVQLDDDSVRPAARRWPKSFVTQSGATLLFYQPQPRDWVRDAITLHWAVSYAPKSGKATLGAVVVEADTVVDLREQIVRFSPFTSVDANFPSLAPAEVKDVVAFIEDGFPADARSMNLDSVLAAVDHEDLAPNPPTGLRDEPPSIFVSRKPAIIVNIDRNPIWRAAFGDTLKVAVNTNWDLYQHAPTDTYYLRNGARWLKASNVFGPWTAAATLPSNLDNVKSIETSPPARRPSANAPITPLVFVSPQPAELIVLKGDARYARVRGTNNLYWVTNTDSDVFRQGLRGPIYYLVAGRWFVAPDFSGPWSFATNDLPRDFQKIPVDHPRSHVLASVPGTAQAIDAMLLARTKQIAWVNKRALKAPTVVFKGTPDFRSIAWSSVAYAVNTDKDILYVARKYYMCHEGIWFVANQATGPWRVTGTVPRAIFEIPASSAAYRVTFVTVDQDYEDWTVFATAPGYYGTLIGETTVVWGTGYTYSSYVAGSITDPIYVHRPITYGAGAWYSPRAAAFEQGRSGYGPPAPLMRSSRIYDHWDPMAVVRADPWRHPVQATADAVGTSGVLPIPQVIAANDVLAGRDGNVYRRRAEGWQKYENGGWTSVRRVALNDASILHRLDRDAQARSEGDVRRRLAAESTR